MAKSTPTLLPLKAARKRSSWEQRTQQASRGASVLFKAFNAAPKMIETPAGDMVRDWSPSDWRHMTNDDVSKALRGQTAFDHDELLASLPPQTIKDALTRGWLQQGSVKGLYVVTKKAAVDLNLPRKSRSGLTIRFAS